MNESRPDRQQICDMMRASWKSCVLGAAAELDLFSILAADPLPADEVARRLGGDRRAVTMLLDAVAALELLEKRDDRYHVPPELKAPLGAGDPETLLPMLQHLMNTTRAWTQLAWVAKAGIPAPRQASVRGFQADRAAFIAAMHSTSGPPADGLVARLGPPQFQHLLDVGGASGTWTIAFLRAVPDATATIFDLPDAIAQARQRFAGSELAERVRFVAGDFYVDDLPTGADYAWLSAIIHQHSRQHSRELFAKVHAALRPGGRIAIREVVMEPCRTRPVFGALFAINMLANTETGMTYTFDEIAADLRQAGFVEPLLSVESDDMNSVVTATKPA